MQSKTGSNGKKRGRLLPSQVRTHQAYNKYLVEQLIMRPIKSPKSRFCLKKQKYATQTQINIFISNEQQSPKPYHIYKNLFSSYPYLTLGGVDTTCICLPLSDLLSSLYSNPSYPFHFAHNPSTFHPKTVEKNFFCYYNIVSGVQEAVSMYDALFDAFLSSTHRLRETAGQEWYLALSEQVFMKTRDTFVCSIAR